jgi:hypothetical protein
MAALGPAAVPGGGQQEAFPHKLYIAGVPKDYTVEQLQPTFDPVGSHSASVAQVCMSRLAC